VIGFGISMFLRNALMGFGALAMLVLTSGKLAALVVLGVPATLVPNPPPRPQGAPALARETRTGRDVSAYVDESIHEIRTVQAYGHEDADRQYFGERAEAAYASGVERIGNKAFLISAVMLIAFCAVGLILWIGRHDVARGRITAGELSGGSFSTDGRRERGRSALRDLGRAAARRRVDRAPHGADGHRAATSPRAFAPSLPSPPAAR